MSRIRKILAIVAATAFIGFFTMSAHSQSLFNHQINYQGKLTNSSGVPVADGLYSMKFRLYTTLTSATTTNIWEEIDAGSDKIQVTGGLFSVMLGSTTPLTSVNFNQTLYLGVEIGGTGTPVYDGEMSPRKKLGAVPAAFEAEKFGGLATTSFLRSDAVNSTSTATNWLTFTNNGAGNIAVFTGSGNIGIGTTSPYAKLSISANPAETNTTLFAISSSTASATSSLFTVLNSGFVGIGTLLPTAQLDITGTSSTAVLGSEMISATADRDFSSDTGKWTGTNWSIGSGVETHVAGVNDLTLNNTALTAAPVAEHTYQVTFTVNTTVAGTLTPKFGAVSGVGVGKIIGTETQTQVIVAFNTNALTFTPSFAWTGTIDNISVKEITPSSATQIIRNSDGTIGLEIRSGGGLLSTFIGLDAGRANTTGTNNTANGFKALYSNTTGIRNTANGSSALFENTTGNDNIAFGYLALNLNVTGSDNSAFGTGALQKNISGLNNTAIGSIALGSNTTGSYNIGMGYQSGYNIASGYDNIFLGHDADIGGTAISTGFNNIGMGYNIKFPSSATNNMLNIGNFLFANLPATTSATTLTTQPLTGQLGVGTSSPYAKLTVWGQGTGTGQAFEIANNASTTLAKFLDDGTGYFLGNIGIGTTTPYAKLSVVGEAVASFFTATSTTATSTFAGGLNVGSGALTYDLSSGVTSISNLSLGAQSFESDAGIVSWADMPVSSSPTQGTIESYSAQMAGNPLLTVYGEALGASGGVWHDAVGIGTTTPFARLSIVGVATTSASAQPLFDIASTSGASFLRMSAFGNLGIGTTTPGTLLSLGNTGNDTINISATATSTFGSGLNIRTGCFAINGVCVGGSGPAATTYLALTDTPSTFTASAIPYTNTGATALLHNANFVFDGTNLGVGTSSPYAKLSVSQTGGGSSPLFSIASSTNGAATSTYLHLDAYGNFNIGTTTDSINPTQPGKLTIDCGGRTQNCTDSIGNINDFLEHNIMNLSTGAKAQSGYSATADTGTLTTNFIFMGVNNSQFWNPTAFNVGGPLDTNILSDSNDFFIAQGIAGKKTHFLNGGVSTSTNEVMTFSGNNIGVGTTSPYAKLTVWGTDVLSTSKAFEVANNASTSLFSISNTGIFAYGANATTTPNLNSAWAWTISTTTGQSASSTLFRVDTTTNAEKVIIGSGFASSTAHGSVIIGDVGAPSDLVFEENSTIRGNGTGRTLTFGASTDVINFQVNTGFGTTSPWKPLSVTGAVSFASLNTGAGAGALCLTSANEVVYNAGATACSVSSQRFKTDILSSAAGLAELMKLRPVSFRYKEGFGDNGASEYLGLIAEEAALVDPRLVVFDASNTPYSIKYENVSSLLVKSVQDVDLNLENIASTTASSTPESQSFTASFFANIFSRVGAWLADAANGITKIFAGEVHTDKLCVGDTCVTQDQFLRMVQSGGGGSGSGSTASGQTAASAESTPPSSGATTDTSAPAASPSTTDTSSSTPPTDQTAPAATDSDSSTTTAP